VHVSILPGADPETESHHIALLLVPYVLHVRVDPHREGRMKELLPNSLSEVGQQEAWGL